MQQIIGIIGCVGSGKDTCGDYLVNHYKFQKIAYADKVKDVASIVFGWDRDLMQGSTKESREWREQVDEFWGISPRAAMQKIGTDMFREHICKDVWIKSVVKKIQSTTDNYVITDCRFENEVEAIKNLGGKVIYIQRGEEPEWAAEAREGKPCRDGIHISDWNPYMLTKYADNTIVNNSTLEELYRKIDILRFYYTIFRNEVDKYLCKDDPDSFEVKQCIYNILSTGIDKDILDPTHPFTLYAGKTKPEIIVRRLYDTIIHKFSEGKKYYIMTHLFFPGGYNRDILDVILMTYWKFVRRCGGQTPIAPFYWGYDRIGEFAGRDLFKYEIDIWKGAELHTN